MQKSLLIVVSILISFNIITAQDIVGKLGGTTANETYDITDSDDNLLFRVQGDGNVGIGTTNPLSKLSVGGDGDSEATIYGGTDAVSGRGVSGYASESLGRGVYGQATGSTSGHGVHGRASGSTGIGVYAYASGSSGHGVYSLAMGSDGRGVSGYAGNTGDVENYGGHFQAKGSSGRGVYGYASKTGFLVNFGGYFKAAGDWGRGVYGSASGSSGYGVFGYASGSSGQGVRGNGVAYDFYAANTGSTNYGSASSIRWKNNIVEIDNPLEKLSEIRGVYFDWDEEHGGKHGVGVIAEEVGRVLPEIVTYEENGIDANGMDYSMLTPLLIEAIKALQKRVEELESK